MYDLTTLCTRIHLPAQVTAAVLSEDKGDPALGFQVLADHLVQACRCWETYERLGISEEIYIDTMACFSRFVREHLASFGCYGFDRGFWTTRQISAKLFRIGQLEYELLEAEGQKSVSLHIPSDCLLQEPLLRESREQAGALIAKTFPDFARVPWVCSSWLLSPDLPGLLPKDSNIVRFQRAFTLTGSYPDPDFKEWVYKRTDIPNDLLPEDTSLQRALKAFLLAGNTFLSGSGVLRADAFTD